MSGVVLFAPESQSAQNRPMVIQQTHRIPEVRLYPPNENIERVAPTNVAHQSNNRQQWVSVMAQHDRWEFPPTDPSLNTEDAFEDWTPFHMRPSTLTAFQASQSTYRNTYRTYSVAIQRARAGWVSSAAKSLDLVRQNLQQSINKELDEVIKRYVEKFFTPAIENIRRNNGENSVSDEHIHTVCKQILEDAKRMYTCSFTRGSTPLGDNSDSEVGSHGEGRIGQLKVILNRKRKDSDTDSEASLRPFKKKGRPPSSFATASGRLTPSKQSKPGDHVKKEGPKWDPNRLTKDTQFVMGARANKALGFGTTRGRLYIKHPDIFKYCGDAEDKQWLYDHNMMPGTGGKAYMLVLDDIKDLLETDEYKNSSALMLDELIGFSVTENMLSKMRSCMNSQRTDIPDRRHHGRLPQPAVTTADQSGNHFEINKGTSLSLLGEYSGASPSGGSGIFKTSEIQSSGPGSPSDDLDLLATDPSVAQSSPFMLSNGLEDVSPAPVESSPTPSDLQAAIAIEPSLSAPFNMSECHP